MTAPTRDELLNLERQFWDAMLHSDGKAAAALTADDCVLVGAQGASTIQPKDLEAMLGGGGWTIESYTLDEASVQIRVMDDGAAVIAYQATENLTVEGQPVVLKVADASVWHRIGGQWVCVLHTESILGDPFGRDRH